MSITLGMLIVKGKEHMKRRSREKLLSLLIFKNKGDCRTDKISTKKLIDTINNCGTSLLNEDDVVIGYNILKIWIRGLKEGIQ